MGKAKYVLLPSPSSSYVNTRPQHACAFWSAVHFFPSDRGTRESQYNRAPLFVAFLRCFQRRVILSFSQVFRPPQTNKLEDLDKKNTAFLVPLITVIV